MKARVSVLLFCSLAAGILVWGQAATGTITGVVVDPGGAVVGNAAIEVKNTDTGIVYPTVSTATGNYTVTQLPPGPYSLSVTVAGFKIYNRTGLNLPAATTLPVTVKLEVGAASESITVNAEATLLKTESGDLAT